MCVCALRVRECTAVYSGNAKLNRNEDSEHYALTVIKEKVVVHWRSYAFVCLPFECPLVCQLR